MPPPMDAGRPRPMSGAPSRPEPARYPSVIEYGGLAGLPVPLQVAVTAAMLPYEAAVTSVKLLKLTEELLGEVVFHLRALRPAVATMSQAYADGHFDPVFRTLNQLQQGTDAIAFAWSPLSTVRDVVIPGQYRRGITPPPPAAPMAPPAPVEPAAPTMSEWVGGFGGRMWGQAAGLPGLVARQLRAGLPEPAPEQQEQRYDSAGPARYRAGSLPAASADGGTGDEDPPASPVNLMPDLAMLQPMIDRAMPLVPGPFRRLFGG